MAWVEPAHAQILGRAPESTVLQTEKVAQKHQLSHRRPISSSEHQNTLSAARFLRIYVWSLHVLLHLSYGQEAPRQWSAALLALNSYAASTYLITSCLDRFDYHVQSSGDGGVWCNYSIRPHDPERGFSSTYRWTAGGWVVPLPSNVDDIWIMYPWLAFGKGL